MDLLPSSSRRRLDSHLRRRLSHLLDPEQLGPMAGLLRDYVLAGGKRLRPQLCLWTMQRCATDVQGIDDPLDEAALDVACAWELFHAFLLVHDDIIDDSDHRRRRPSLHRALAGLDSDSAAFGINLGIVAGDLLFAAALTLLHEVALPADKLRKTLRLFSRVALRTGAGQAADIIQSHVAVGQMREEAVLRGYHGKTAAYTFEGPMLSGAILGGACAADQQACIRRYAVALGQAYQLHNDLLDLAAPVHDGCDLVQGKRTLTLIQARSLLAGSDRLELDNRIAAIRPGMQDACEHAEALRKLLYTAGAVDATKRVMSELLRDARRAADDDCLALSLREGLLGLLHSLNERHFAVGV